MSKRVSVFVFLMVASCQQMTCPSAAGDDCNPRSYDCPGDYYCALIERCTRECEQVSDCWIKSNNGCRYPNQLPGGRLDDGGYFVDVDDEGYCTDSRSLECRNGYCVHPELVVDDMYGPSPNKGNQTQGPRE